MQNQLAQQQNQIRYIFAQMGVQPPDVQPLLLSQHPDVDVSPNQSADVFVDKLFLGVGTFVFWHFEEQEKIVVTKNQTGFLRLQSEESLRGSSRVVFY